MTFTKSELTAIERRTPDELAAINSWWRGLSPDDRRAHLNELEKRAHNHDAIRGVFALIAALGLIALPIVMVCAELVGRAPK